MNNKLFSKIQDIKPANLLIDQNDVLKIADFGLSRIFSSEEDKCYSPQVYMNYLAIFLVLKAAILYF